MIRTLFAATFLTIALLFVFQIRSEIMDPVVAAISLAIVAVSLIYVNRVTSGHYDRKI